MNAAVKYYKLLIIFKIGYQYLFKEIIEAYNTAYIMSTYHIDENHLVLCSEC